MSDVVDGTAVDLPQEEPAPLNAVIVVRNEDEEGNITVDVMPHGTVKADQVQTLLELALPAWRQKIGLTK